MLTGNCKFIHWREPFIYLISLRRAQERRARALKRLEQAGIPFEIVDAVDGAKLNRAGIATDNAPNNASLACSISHFDALSRFLNTKRERCIILEDDFKPLDDIALRMGCIPVADYVALHRMNPDLPPTPKAEVLFQRAGWEALDMAPLMTVGIMVSRAFAFNALLNPWPISTYIDHYYRLICHRHAYTPFQPASDFIVNDGSPSLLNHE